MSIPHDFNPHHAWLGIPPDEQPPDHYRLLGIERFEDDAEVIAAAADRHMAHVRTFQSGQRAGFSQRLLNELSAARLCLLDPNTKATYDAVLKGRVAAEQSGVAGLPTDQHGAAPAATPPYGAPSAAMARPRSSGTSAALTPAPSAVAQPGPPPPGAPAADPLSAGAATKRHGVADARTGRGESPFYLQLWFPLAIVAGTVVIVGLAVSLGVLDSALRKGRDETTAEPNELPGQPTPTSQNGNRKKKRAPPGAPIVVQRADGEVVFVASAATIHGNLARCETREGHGAITNWTSQQDWLSWEFRLTRPAVFRVEVTYATPPAAGGRYTLSVGEVRRSANVRSSGGVDRFTTTDVGFLRVSTSGRHTLKMKIDQKPAGELLILRSIRFTAQNIGRVRS